MHKTRAKHDEGAKEIMRDSNRGNVQWTPTYRTRYVQLSSEGPREVSSVERRMNGLPGDAETATDECRKTAVKRLEPAPARLPLLAGGRAREGRHCGNPSRRNMGLMEKGPVLLARDQIWHVIARDRFILGSLFTCSWAALDGPQLRSVNGYPSVSILTRVPSAPNSARYVSL
jgi:hypothetical protein